MSKKILLGFFMVPEDYDFYIIEDPTDEQLATIELACGWLNNFEPDGPEEKAKDAAAAKINLAFVDKEGIDASLVISREEDRKWVGIWSHLEKHSWEYAIDLTGIDKLYITGFCL